MKHRVWFARARALVWVVLGVVSFPLGWANSVVLVWMASVYANVESGIASSEAADDSKIMLKLKAIHDDIRGEDVSQPESKLSRDIMNELRARGVFCFKVHGGPTMMAGLPDIIACVPVDLGDHMASVGLFIGFETKTPSGKEPTAIQHRVHDKIRAAHGAVYVVRSVQDAVDALTALGAITTPPHG
jgi:hypothetical protein